MTILFVKFQDYVIYTEFQATGSYTHIIWVKNAPTLEQDVSEGVIIFVVKYQKCRIPEEDGERRELILMLLKHMQSSTCGSHGSCKFKFPKM